VKKKFKYGLFFIGLFLIVFSIKKIIKQEIDQGVNIDNQKWEKRYPQVFNNSGYNKLIESDGILNKLKNNPESLQKLQGKITNEFGIRDDILEYILSLNLNTQANYAAIRMAQSEYLSYFFSNDKITVNNLANKEMLSSFCLMNFVGFNYMHKIHSEIDTKLRNTKERNERMWWVDNNYLGYHVIGTGLSTADEKEKCKRGDY
jgi:hypothetical protein